MTTKNGQDQSEDELEQLISSPGPDELMTFYENVEDVYRSVIEANSIYDSNGVTTNSTNATSGSRAN